MKTPDQRLAVRIRKELGLKSGGRQSGRLVLSSCCLLAGQELPREVYHAAYGIAWALDTGRLPGRLHQQIERMTGYEMAGLVATVATSTQCSGEVPVRLITMESAQ